MSIYQSILLLTSYLHVYVLYYVKIGYEQLDSALHHYDTLHTHHIKHSYTPSSTSDRHHRHVKFNTLGRCVCMLIHDCVHDMKLKLCVCVSTLSCCLACRNFHLSLVHNDGIFSSNFGALVVGKDGWSRQVHLDKEEFYHGRLHGEGTTHTHTHHTHTHTHKHF